LHTRSAIVVIVDRLGSGYLGPYGNTWIDTPEFNRLASQSWVFEQAISDSASLSQVYRSYLLGTHAMCPEPDSGTLALPQMATQAGLDTALITDEPCLEKHPLVAGFRERIRLSPSMATTASEAEEQTHFGQLFSTALNWLSGAETPFLLWLHSQGMERAWDAPWSYRERFADEEDPRPPEFVRPPNHPLGPNDDPDDILGIAQAYAGQLSLLDLCLGILLDTVEDCPFCDETLIFFASPRGFPLGEHGRLGACGDDLYGEVLNTPLMLWVPRSMGEGGRVPTLVQPGDLSPTVSKWLDLPFSPACCGRDLLELTQDEPDRQRECACSLGDRQRSIRTPAWFLREDDSGSKALYSKPDDRWEVNEVADRCVEVVPSLIATLDQFCSLAQSHRLADLPPLPSLLLEGME